MKKPYRLYNGDCFEILKDFPENTFDMVFADPPYMLSNGGISCQNGKMVSVNKGAWDICQRNGFEYIAQATADKIKKKWNKDITVTKSSKRIDFAVNTPNKLYLIETTPLKM